MKTLIIAEHDEMELHRSTHHTVSAALQLNTNSIDVLVIGSSDCSNIAAKCQQLENVNEVLLAQNNAYTQSLAENAAELIASIAKDYRYILAPATTYGKNLLPRVAALLDIEQLSDIIGIADDNTFIRPIYAGNAFSTIKSSQKQDIITVRTTAFDECATTGNASLRVIDAVYELGLSKFISNELTKSERPDLANAKIVVSGGRGLSNKENFSLIDQLADKLNAAVGASRAAVDAEFVPNDYQVGQTGKVVAPDLYIAVGISGAIQHLAGMKDSKVIVAINKDPDAPIFQIADYGLVGDLFEILPELTSKL